MSVLRLVRRLDTLARLFVLPCFVNDMLEPFFDGMRRSDPMMGLPFDSLCVCVCVCVCVCDVM